MKLARSDYRMSDAEADRICADVLRLVRAVLADTQRGPVLDRVGRSPLHDEVFGVPQEAA